MQSLVINLTFRKDVCFLFLLNINKMLSTVTESLSLHVELDRLKIIGKIVHFNIFWLSNLMQKNVKTKKVLNSYVLLLFTSKCIFTQFTQCFGVTSLIKTAEFSSWRRTSIFDLFNVKNHELNKRQVSVRECFHFKACTNSEFKLPLTQVSGLKFISQSLLSTWSVFFTLVGYF